MKKGNSEEGGGVCQKNVTDNQCPSCSQGWTGMNCGFCNSNAVCQNGGVCSRDPITVVSKQFQCQVNSSTWVYLFFNGRPGGELFFLTTCNKKSGSDDLFDCFISAWRKEPHDAWIDNFFNLNMFSCTMEVKNTSVSYNCPTSIARCGANPPMEKYQPFCQVSTFGVFFLPKLTHGGTLKCELPSMKARNPETMSCSWMSTDLGNDVIPLADCIASECLK